MNTKKHKAKKRHVSGFIILGLICSGLMLAGFRIIGVNLFSKNGIAKMSADMEPGAGDVVGIGGNGEVKLTKAMESDRDIPLMLQTDERWGKKKYGGDYMAITGCGPTCLSMVKTGLTGNKKWNPYKVAKKAEEGGFYVEGHGSSWELMTAGAESIGLRSKEVIFDESHILKELQAGHPIICAMRPGDFTTEGHFIVLADARSDGRIMVNDPNSFSLSKKLWTLDRLMPQIRNLWSFEVADK